MAKKERQKRAARQARSQERERTAADAQTSEASVSANASSRVTARPQTKKDAKPASKGRFRAYLSSVKTEMHRVVWPSKQELKNYSIAVVAMLVVCGIAIWLIDTGFVALLVSYTGLRG